MKDLEVRIVSAKWTTIRFPLLILIVFIPCCKAKCRQRDFSPTKIGIPCHFQIDDMTEDECLNLDQKHGAIVGSGREINLFDFVTRRGGDSSSFFTEKPITPSFQRRSSTRRNGRSGGRSKNFIRPNSSTTAFSGTTRPSTNMFQSVRDWLANGNLPKIQCRVEPNTTLKVRKTFRPLKTIIRLGADFNTQLGVWQFRSSWEDALIGGKLTLAGRELQFTKTWLLSVGAFYYIT